MIADQIVFTGKEKLFPICYRFTSRIWFSHGLSTSHKYEVYYTVYTYKLYCTHLLKLLHFKGGGWSLKISNT